eukprot:scaffold25910_cov76-Phaeocystis_antarctica.AAC.4
MSESVSQSVSQSLSARGTQPPRDPQTLLPTAAAAAAAAVAAAAAAAPRVPGLPREHRASSKKAKSKKVRPRVVSCCCTNGTLKPGRRPVSALLTHDSYGAPPALVLGTLERHDAHCAVVVDAARGGDVAAVTREGRAVRAEDAEEAHLGKGQV